MSGNADIGVERIVRLRKELNTFSFLFVWLHRVLCGMQTQLQHVGSSSLTRDRTIAPCIGTYWTTREVPKHIFLCFE